MGRNGMVDKNPNPLQAALAKEATQDKPGRSFQPGKATKRERLDRSATVMIGGHFQKSFKMQLRLIAAEEDTTSQALLEEALNLLFVKKGKKKIEN